MGKMDIDNGRIRLDRMRYNKNLLSSRICYLAILLNVLYFVTLYRIDNKRFYEVMMGVSVVYNLLFMLLCFLASEGVKNYKTGHGYLLLGLGLGQIVRIFIWPANLASAVVTMQEVKKREGRKMVTVLEEVIIPGALPEKAYFWTILYLSLSAACCLAAGVIAIVRSQKLKKYNAFLAELTV